MVDTIIAKAAEGLGVGLKLFINISKSWNNEFNKPFLLKVILPYRIPFIRAIEDLL